MRLIDADKAITMAEKIMSFKGKRVTERERELAISLINQQDTEEIVEAGAANEEV